MEVNQKIARRKGWVKPFTIELPERDEEISTIDPPHSKRLKKSDTPEKEAPAPPELSKTQSSNTIITMKKKGTPKVNDNWVDVFAPTAADELALHPKKLSEVSNWFQHCSAILAKHPAQLCLITGPAGSGKTAAIHVLAKEFQYKIYEWINPVDGEIDAERKTCQLDAFKAFLWRSSRYQSLLDHGNKRLVLIEDFPNVLISDASALESIIEEYQKYGKAPLVFIVTDSRSRSLNIAYNLFPEEMRQRFNIQHIAFNSIATTIMQKAMKRFCGLILKGCDKGDYKTPTPNIVESIILSAQGDIRNAVLSLHFTALKGGVALELLRAQESATSSKPSTSVTASKRKKKECRSLKSIGCDETLTLMHALGRVFNPKLTDEKRFLHSPENLTNAFSTEPKQFIAFVHANYAGHFDDIGNITTALHGLMMADMYLSEYRETALANLGLNVGIRAVMVANERPVTGWMPVRGPKRLNVSVKQSPKCLKMNFSSGFYVREFSTYVEIIEKGQPDEDMKKIEDGMEIVDID